MSTFVGLHLCTAVITRAGSQVTYPSREGATEGQCALSIMQQEDVERRMRSLTASVIYRTGVTASDDAPSCLHNRLAGIPEQGDVRSHKAVASLPPVHALLAFARGMDAMANASTSPIHQTKPSTGLYDIRPLDTEQ